MSLNVRNITLNHKILTFGLRNIILFYRNIMLRLEILTSHFTDKEKILTLRFRNITLTSIIIMLSFANITLCSSNMFNNSNVSALDYSSNVGIGFTFNPTLSISLSSSDLIIDNLKPGTAEDSNSINVSVATNAAYGYNLSATVGSNTYNNTSLNNINSSDNNDNNNNNDSSNYTFNSIATNADLPSLTTNNTWGYSYKLSNDSSWSNYSGLPLFSDSNNKTLVDKYTESEDTINFKIAAKASNTQPSGTYSNVINFNAVAYAVPMSLADSYAYFGAELYHGYYKMQDMTTRICQTTEAPSELQVIDVRDDKVYWIAKLADGNCWMTQNLDLDLTSNPEADNYIALTSKNTDLNDTASAAYQDGYSMDGDGVISWVPERDTIAYNKLDNWQDNNVHPYSYDYLDVNGNPVYPDKNATQQIAGNHGLSGNYYNWPAAVASNNSSTDTQQKNKEFQNSICPKNWKLPSRYNPDNFTNLRIAYVSAKKVMQSPAWFIRSGILESNIINLLSVGGYCWTNTNFESYRSYGSVLDIYSLYPTYFMMQKGQSVRCLAR